MGDRLDQIRERWAPWQKFDIGDDGELWAGDMRLGDIDEASAEKAIANAPEDVAWLRAEVERLRSTPSAASQWHHDYRVAIGEAGRYRAERDAALDLLNDALDFAESYLRGDDDHSVEWLKDWARRAQAAMEARNA